MYVNEGDLEKANDCLQKFQMNREPSSQICATIMDVFAEKGFWAEAESMLYRKRDMAQLQNRDIIEFNVMIKAYGKAKLYDKAVCLFEEMKNQGVWPNDSTYKTIIQMLSGADLVDQARNLTVEMQEMGFKPDCQTFTAVIGCYVRLGQLFDAVDVYQEMLRAGVKPTEVVYGSIINGFAEHGTLGEALGYFHLMKETGLSENLVVLSALLKSYSKSGDLEGVKSTFEQMQNMEGGLDLMACNSMITAFAELGLVSEAKLMFENLKETGRTNSTSYEIMMYLYKDIGLMDEAIKMAEEMKLLGLLEDSISYNKVLNCYAINKQYHEFVELLREMISKKVVLNRGTLKVLLTVLKKGGFPIEAVEQLESCYQEGKPYALQAAYTAMYTLLGMHTLALESAQTLLVSEVENLDSTVYNVAIYVYTSAGDVEKALNIYMKMLDKHLEPDIVTHIYLVTCYGKAGMVEGVKKIHRLLEYGEIERSETLIQAIKFAYKNCNRKFRRVMRFKFDTEENSEGESETEYVVVSESETETEYDVGSEGETEYDVGSEGETEYDIGSEIE
jgi:pentatricopeptide repeat protein